MRDQITRTRLLRAEGRFAFYVTVQDIAHEGLEGALDPPQDMALKLWRQSEQPAWLFLDSVDEAKLDGIQLRRALRKVANGINGAERRVSIILSSRYTDWDAKADLESFETLMPPQSTDLPKPPSEADMLGHILRHEKLPEPAQVIPAQVFVMATLDEPRVRKYAGEKDLPALETFMAAIGSANLWRFARRPLDLGWMVDF